MQTYNGTNKQINKQLRRVQKEMENLRAIARLVRDNCKHQDLAEAGWGVLHSNCTNVRICKECGMEEPAPYSGGGGFKKLRPDVSNSYWNHPWYVKDSDEFYSYRIPWLEVSR